MPALKVLYLSCHSILEFDELSLFAELGISVFALGAYLNPSFGSDNMRPGIRGAQYDLDDLAAFRRLAQSGAGDPKERLTKAFVDRFDAVLVMHLPQWISQNWQAIRHKPVVWRTIGQSDARCEALVAPYRAEGLKIVRCSPREQTIPGYCGSDALIRFYKDPREFGQWNGHTCSVITLCQSMPVRCEACNFLFFEQATNGFSRKLFGPGNEEAGDYAVGKVGYEALKSALRDHRIYLYTGTHPASYTLNFIEAWMTGIPIVAVGPLHGNCPHLPGHDLYEIPDLIENGTNGFWSDDLAELRSYIENLMRDEQLAARIGAAGRQRAIECFGKDGIRAEWQDFWTNLERG